jgi:hypothetical protein
VTRAFARSRAVLAGLVGLACLAAGCKGERSERVAASYSSVTQPSYLPAPKRTGEGKLAVASDAIPTEEDYEERATTTINEANLATKLTELEKEMAF